MYFCKYVTADKTERRIYELKYLLLFWISMLKNYKYVILFWNQSPGVNRRDEQTIFDILKFILDSEAQGNKTREMYYSLMNLKMISFVFFPPSLPAKYGFYYIGIGLSLLLSTLKLSTCCSVNFSAISF